MSSLVRVPLRLWKRIRAWRRIYFTRGGALFVLGALAVGFAAMNTGNNLLFLILGAMLGSIVLSSWLSEQSIRDLEIRRRAPRAVTVGRPVRIRYSVRNRKRWIPSLAVEIREAGLSGAAFLPRIDPHATATAGREHRFVRRGVYPLGTVTIFTSFPFGLFRKERDVEIPGELIVWPRRDRGVRPVAVQGESGSRMAVARGGRGRPGIRGEYRGLRGYRPGDDPRDIHWRSTARIGEPVIREFEEDGSQGVWLCLDTRGDDDERIEDAVEVIASLAARLEASARRFALVTPDLVVGPAEGRGQLERVLDALARVEFRPDSPAPPPPVEPGRCVMVSLTGRGGNAFGDVVVPGRRVVVEERS